MDRNVRDRTLGIGRANSWRDGNAGLEPAAKGRRERRRLVAFRIEHDHDAFTGGGAALATEKRLAQTKGAPADLQHPRADIDAAREKELCAEIDLEPDDDEF